MLSSPISGQSDPTIRRSDDPTIRRSDDPTIQRSDESEVNSRRMCPMLLGSAPTALLLLELLREPVYRQQDIPPELLESLVHGMLVLCVRTCRRDGNDESAWRSVLKPDPRADVSFDVRRTSLEPTVAGALLVRVDATDVWKIQSALVLLRLRLRLFAGRYAAYGSLRLHLREHGLELRLGGELEDVSGLPAH
eukprot:scaffold241_cov242-Pinguiococcus_pyrenoidosus.AAC.4